jgi:hypothetical protein
VLCALVPLSLACVGCGRGGEEAGKRLTGEQVRAGFRAQTGDELNVAVSSATAGYVFDDDVSEGPAFHRYEEKYGHFAIYVITTDAERRIDQVLGGLEQDRKGIYWRHVANQGRTFWLAMTIYGQNVVLTWFAPDDEKRVDGRWKLLDRILRRTAAKAGPHRT